MFEMLKHLIEPRTILTIVIAFAAFASVLGIMSTLSERDPLKARMKAVNEERTKLRLQIRQQQTVSDGRLRERASTGPTRQIVDTLKLRKVFEADASRQLLRQAGFRSERHLLVYLLLRFVTPLAVAFLAFAYATTLWGDSLTPSMRLAVAAVAVMAGNYIPFLFVKNLVARRQESIRRAWPDCLDLMLICVESGMAVEPAMQRVSQEIGSVSVALAEELTLTTAELSILPDRRKAFENLALRTGLPQVKAVVTSLIQSERYGTPVGTALRVLAQENRDLRMAEVERKAAALPPKLTVPMMIFFMPVIFVIIGAPAIISSMDQMK